MRLAGSPALARGHIRSGITEKPWHANEDTGLGILGCPAKRRQIGELCVLEPFSFIMMLGFLLSRNTRK
jgi:hypothetical protein